MLKVIDKVIPINAKCKRGKSSKPVNCWKRYVIQHAQLITEINMQEACHHLNCTRGKY